MWVVAIVEESVGYGRHPHSIISHKAILRNVVLSSVTYPPTFRRLT